MAIFADFYNAGNVPEDVINALFDISPLDRPFTGRIAHEGARSNLKEWLDHVLGSPNKDNAIVDAADVAAEDDTTQGVRYRNPCQLFRRVIRLGDQASNSDGFGNITQFEGQLEKRVNELYRDLESSALSRNASVLGATGVAAKNAGFFAQVKTNNTVANGGFGAGGSPGGWNTGTGVFDAPTQSTATRAMSESNILSVLESINVNGGRPDAMTFIPQLKRRFSSFMMSSSSRVGVLVTQAPGGEGGATAVGSVQVYETDFGVLMVLNNQIMQAAAADRADIAIFQTDMALGVDQWTPRAKRLGPTGAGEKWDVTQSCGAILLNERAHGGVFDNDQTTDMVA